LLVVFLEILSYGARLSGRIGTLPSDIFFRYLTAIEAIVTDAIFLLIVLAIARGLPIRETFALRPPRSWRRAAIIGATTLGGAYLLSFAEVALLRDVAREQSVPAYWDPARAAAWIANLLAIAVFVPVFEEALCRGLGYSLLEPLGVPAAVALTALAFTLAHGVIVDIPVIFATGLGLGYMRASTGSLFPCIALHGVFNGFGLIVAAAFAS
jgi:membrane protease YdiL (CAAX protease family)